MLTSLFAALAIWISFTQPAFSDGGARLERMSEHLSLSDAQKARISDLIEAHREDRAIRRGGLDDEDVEKARREARAERQALAEEIASVLNSEQRNQFNEMRRRLGERRLRQALRWRRMIDTLSLSVDQQVAIETLVEGLKAERQGLQRRFRAEIESILTDEQRAEWHALERERSG